MDFRSHLARPMDFRRPSNVMLGVILVVTGGVAVVLWLNGKPGAILFSPVYAGLIWALLREIDPDHEWTALLGAIGTSVWVLTGGEIFSGLAIAGLMLAARIVTWTTGRRPLLIDLAGATVFGIAIGYTAVGWAAGFGIAVAIYLDDRFSRESHLPAVVAAALTAIGTTVVATLSGALPETVPAIVQSVAVGAGLVGLILIARDVAVPISQVDARHAAFIDGARLHVSRSLVGVVTFLTSILVGPEADGVIVVVVALGLAVVSNEIELLRRRRQ